MTEIRALSVNPDEKAYWLIESWKVTDRGLRRIQRIQVLRSDEIAVYETDAGSWDMDTDQPFQAPSFWEYSVAELQDIALEARNMRAPRDPDDHIDLIGVWAGQLDERRMRRQHRSTFGPLVRKVRA